MSLKHLDINISDHDGELRDVDEILSQLSSVYSTFSTHAMSDHALFLHGQKDMLGQVIDYLRRIIT